MLKLIKPAKVYEQKAKEYINEFYKYNSQINGTGHLDKYLKESTYKKWLEYIKKLENTPEPGFVTASTYFLIENDEIIGMINIRHYLNESLLELGGHIGYSIRPTKRGNGYNKINLYLGLKKCQDLGLEKVLITADDNNPASYRTIEALGGILENKVELDNKETYRRYWINVTNALKENKNKYEQTGKDI